MPLEQFQHYLQKTLSFVLSWSVLCVAGLLPLFFIPSAWATVAQSKMLLISIIVIGAAISYTTLSIKRGTISLPFSPMLLSVVVLPVAYVLSMLVSGGISTSLIGSGVETDTLAVVVIWCALSLLALFLLSRGGDIRLVRLTQAMLVGAGLVIAVHIVRLFFPALISFGGSLVGQTASMLGSWQDLGIFLGIVCIISLSAYTSAFFQDRLWRIATLAISGLSFLFLILVNLSDIWVAVAASSALIGAHSVWRQWRDGVSPVRALRSIWVWAALLIAASFFLAFGPTIQSALPTFLQVPQSEVRPSWQGTFQVGVQTLDAPGALLFGSGPNTFVRGWSHYKPVNVNETPFWGADFSSGVGTIPTAIISVGVVGVLAWLLLVAALLWSAYRFLRAPLHSRDGSIHGILLMSAAYLALFHIIYTPGVTVGALLFFSIGAVIALEVRRDMVRVGTYALAGESLWSVARYIAIILITFCFVAASLLVIRAVVSDMFVNSAVVAYSKNGDIDSAQRMIRVATLIAPSNDRAHRAAVEISLIDLQQALSSTTEINAETSVQLQTQLAETIRHGLRAVEVDSYDYQNWLTLARVYGELAGGNIPGAYENAKAAYERALVENPTNPLPHLRIAQLELLKGNTQGARDQLGRALEIKKNFAAAYFLSSQMYASEGNFELAFSEAVEAARYAQNDPLSWFNLGVIAYSSKMYPQSVEAFERAVVLKNDYANALYMLGLAYAQLGEFERAERAYEFLLRLNAGDTRVQQAIEEVRERRVPGTAAAATSSASTVQ